LTGAAALLLVAGAVAAFVASDVIRGSTVPTGVVAVKSVELSPGLVEINGSFASPVILYHSYRAEITGGVMTVQVRGSFLGGTSGVFVIRVPTQGQDVDAVYIVEDGGKRKRVYP